jgi:hypothetical protein
MITIRGIRLHAPLLKTTDLKTLYTQARSQKLGMLSTAPQERVAAERIEAFLEGTRQAHLFLTLWN